MGKLLETTISDFSGGIVNDPRDPRSSVCQVVTNFDILTDPRRMKPYRNSETGHSSASTFQPRSFTIALRTGTTYSLFALGRQSANDRPSLQYVDLSGIANPSWTSPTNGDASTKATSTYNLFIYYRQANAIYGAHTGFLYSYVPSTDTFTDEAQALTYTHITQGLVHSADDVLYIGYYNSAGLAGAKSFIMSKNGTAAFNTTHLTLPDHLIPTSVCEKGNYLAILCADANGVGNSKVILWDRDSTSWNEMYDVGDGSGMVLEEVNGNLVVISQVGGTASSMSNLPTSTHILDYRIVFRALSGTGFVKITELTSTSSTELRISKQKVNNRLYFSLILTLNGSVREGVWSIGQNNNGQWSIVHERTPNNDSALTSGQIRGFVFVGDYLFISYLDNNTSGLSKTNGSEAYATSVWESKIYNGGDSSLKKDLLGATVTTQPLDDSPAASVVARYKKDNETSYTTFMTHDTDGAISDSAVNIESSGAALPKSYREISFRIESTGAIITGFSFKEEIKGRDVYEAIK